MFKFQKWNLKYIFISFSLFVLWGFGALGLRWFWGVPVGCDGSGIGKAHWLNVPTAANHYTATSIESRFHISETTTSVTTMPMRLSNAAPQTQNPNPSQSQPPKAQLKKKIVLLFVIESFVVFWFFIVFLFFCHTEKRSF